MLNLGTEEEIKAGQSLRSTPESIESKQIKYFSQIDFWIGRLLRFPFSNLLGIIFKVVTTVELNEISQLDHILCDDKIKWININRKDSAPHLRLSRTNQLKDDNFHSSTK